MSNKVKYLYNNVILAFLVICHHKATFNLQRTHWTTSSR